jgi:ATP-dependent Zn protease
MTFGYSPVMLEKLLDEALVVALRRSASRLSWEDIHRAKMVTELGLTQPAAMVDNERWAVATHEAGHATVAWLVAPERDLEVLSIIKRSTSLGLLAHSETEERFTQTRSELQHFIAIAMGGLVAEELFLGDTTSGVAADLRAATSIAAQMVGSLGMAGSLTSFEAVEGPMKGNLVARVLADESAARKVETILASARDEVRELIGGHRFLVTALRDALLERDELIGAEIADVLVAAEAAHATVDLRDAGPAVGDGDAGAAAYDGDGVAAD